MLPIRQPSGSDQAGAGPVSSSGCAVVSSGVEQISAALTELAAHDPDVLLAADEVDRSLIRLTLALTPLERVRSAATSAETLARFRRVGR